MRRTWVVLAPNHVLLVAVQMEEAACTHQLRYQISILAAGQCIAQASASFSQSRIELLREATCPALSLNFHSPPAYLVHGH